jgi:hypothetical protein
LQRQDGAGLEAKIGLEVLGNFTNQALERKLKVEKACKKLFVVCTKLLPI